MTTALSMPTGQSGLPGPSANPLSKRKKAAIVVRLLLGQGATIPLATLPGSLQQELINQMAGLSHVDQSTVDAVVDEFINAFDANGLSFPGALEETLSLMEGSVSKETTSRMRKAAGLSLFGDPWSRISGLDVELLLPLVQSESVEIGAVILSKLSVAKAAELLGQLPGERARRITYAVSLTDEIAPALVQQIGQSLAEQLDTQPDREFAAGPVERVGAILNFSPAATREEVLQGLEQSDAEFAAQVRKAIFTFANIPERVDPKDVPKITKDVDPARLLEALAGATGEDIKVVEFILSNMSNRMADQLREDMEELGTVKPKIAEAAMTAVVIAVRELADSGGIFLVAEPEEDDA